MTTTCTMEANGGPKRRKAEARGKRSDVPADRSSVDMPAGDLESQLPAHVEYIRNPLFEMPDAEAQLLRKRVTVPRWSYFREGPEEPGRVPPGPTRLSNADEVTLFLQYNYCRCRLSRLIESHAGRWSQASAGEALLWHRRAEQTRAAIVRANMALVVAMAKRSQNSSVEFSELISEGNMALLRSVDKFDVSRGFRFSTYACRAILKSFNRLTSKAERYRRCFPTEFDPCLERSDYAETKHRMQRESCADDLRQILLRNRARLSDVELTVVMERFAIGTEGKVRTLSEVAKIVGLTSERVRQIQRAALGKIRLTMEVLSLC